MADVIKDLPQTQYVMIDNFLIDVSIREDHEFDAEVTDYPTESGASFADNIRKRPIRVTMEGLVSNSPIGPIAMYRRAEGEQLAFGATGTPNALGAASVEEAYVALLVIWNRREPVTIRTSLGTFERMAMTSLSIPREAQTGAALHFTAQFQQIEVVVNDRLLRKRTATRGGGGRNNRGTQISEVKGQGNIIWRKGRDRSDNYYVGGGFWFGEMELLVMLDTSHGKQLFHNNIYASTNKILGIKEFEAVTDENNNIVDTAEIAQARYRELSDDEKARFSLDRKRDIRTKGWGQSLLSNRVTAKLLGAKDWDVVRRIPVDMNEVIKHNTSMERGNGSGLRGLQ